MHLKLHQKERRKKQQKQLVLWLKIKLLIKSQEPSKNNSEKNEEEILREKYILPELKQKIIDDLRLKEEKFWRPKIKGRKLM